MNYLRIVEKGSTGEDVKILQEKLENLGYYYGTITGSFGKSTEEAVVQFQLDNGLVPDGIVGQKTWDLLYEKTEFNTYSIEPTLYFGQKGDEVSKLQKELKATLYYTGGINANFDVETLNAVKRFQYNNHITADGVVGNDTWYFLNNQYSKIANCNDSDEYYTVVAGDTLYSIARKFNMTVNELKIINNLSNDIISIGQKLKVKKNEDINNVEEYIVKPGDTLYSIARKFNTSVDELKRINNLTSNIISINQILKIKQTPTEDYYIVKPGDTLYSIAINFKTTVEELKTINNLTSNILSIGQKLLIPTTSYTVMKGDTLYSIARKFNVSIESIKKKNNLSSNVISIGQKLII